MKRVILRKSLRPGKIIKKIKGKELWLVEFYDENNYLQYDVISKVDVVSESEYEKIKNRRNRINKILSR